MVFCHAFVAEITLGGSIFLPFQLQTNFIVRCGFGGEGRGAVFHSPTVDSNFYAHMQDRIDDHL